jgi:inorganic pyrophosphatase
MDPIDIVIETPRGSSQKYDYDPESKFFRMKKILPAGMVFPYDFGFIPNTKGEDGDPLDIMIISEFNSFPGCMITCRIIGGIKAKQLEKEKKKAVRNDRFMAVPVQSSAYEKINDIKDLAKKTIKDIQHFFINYNELEGRVFTPIDLLNSTSAMKTIEESRT